jgi:hypothetical protein
MTLASSSAAASAAVPTGPQQQQQQQHPFGRQQLVSNSGYMFSPTRRGTAVNDDGVVAATAQGDMMGGQVQSSSAAPRFVSVSSPGVQGVLLFPVQQQQGQQQQQQQAGQQGLQGRGCQSEGRL